MDDNLNDNSLENFKNFHTSKMEDYKVIDGVKYRVVRYRCVCSCHTSGAIHIAPCCNDGFKEYLEKIEDL